MIPTKLEIADIVTDADLGGLKRPRVLLVIEGAVCHVWLDCRHRTLRRRSSRVLGRRGLQPTP
jgi:hypothetical protein